MEKLVLVGIDQVTVAEILEINKTTLLKHFKKELKHGKTKRVANVAGALYNNAINGNVTAQIFIMKTQAGWREIDHDPNENKQRRPVTFRETGKGERIDQGGSDEI